MSLNKVMLIGNVGRDPEIRYLEGNSQGGGTKVATFTLATTERYRDRNGELRENTEWHNIVAWRQTADVVERFVKKGTQLYIEGRLRTRSYTDQQGIKKYTTEINADNLQLLGRRQDDQGQGGGYQQSGQAWQQPQGGGYQQSGQAWQQPQGGQGWQQGQQGGQGWQQGQQGGYQAAQGTYQQPSYGQQAGPQEAAARAADAAAVTAAKEAGQAPGYMSEDGGEDLPF